MKKQIHTIVIFCLALCIGVVAKPLTAGSEEKDCQGKACVDFGETFEKDTPFMEKALKGKVKSRRFKEKKEKKIHPKCLDALDLPDGPDKEDQIQKFCKKSPGFERKESHKKNIIIGGKKRGKKIKNKTILKFQNAKQRYGHEKRKKWSNLIFKQPKTGDMTRGVYKNNTNTKDKARKKMFFVEETETENDDKDCIDRVTGEHLRGEGCFESDGALKQTLSEEVPDGCKHYNGTFLYGDKDDGEEDDCYYEDGTLKTSLEELIDEDGPSPDNENVGDGIYDIDGDGRDGEDGPNPGTYPINDDRDCIDMATGEHLDLDSCFQANGELKKTLTEAFFGCVDKDDKFHECDPECDPYDFIEDDCYDENGNAKGGMFPEPHGCMHETFFSGNPGDGIDDDCYDANDQIKPGLIPHPDGGCIRYIFFDGDPEGTFFAGVQDGVEDDCYWANNEPKPDTTEVGGGCLKQVENECYDAEGNLKTTLAELVDEDDGLPIDDDDDGLVDEDPSHIVNDFETACYAKAKKIAGDDAFDTTGIYTEEGGCDLTRAAIVKINKKCNNAKGEKCFKADDQGYYDENEAPEGHKYGEEEREIVIEETVTVMCEDGMQLDDVTGQCVPDEQVDELKAFRAALITGVAVDDKYVMMGFTFAPPSIRWGLFYKEQVCFWFFGCFTLFETKIGYDFDLGVGFRLPMKATVSNLPEGPIVAEDEMALSTNIEPENFSAQQYTDFCDNYDMGDTAFCDRFAFPDALDPNDGDELAIRLKAFAGLKLVILEIPLINWGVDVDMDMPEMCSLYLALNSIEDVAAKMANQGLSFAEAVNALGLNCGTYTTPFGNDDEGNPLQFPFIANAPFINQMVRADCAEAFVRNETIKLPNGQIYPICTGLILGVHGASLGLGLGVDLEMNSNLIEATASVSGDAVFSDKNPNAEQKVDLKYHAAESGGSDPVEIDTIKVDNYDDSDNHARLNLNDFTYCLNNFSIRLKGQAMFGGILTIFPDFPDFTIYRFTVPFINETCFIPIGQHAGTGEGYEVPVFVDNYGLDIDVQPAPPTDEEDTLEIEPGEFGQFTVEVTNKGNVTGSFDNFIYQLYDKAPNGGQWTTDPTPDVFKNMEIENVSGDGKGSLILSIKPFRHPLTSPGKYPFTISADSKEAKDHGLSTPDPSGNSRTGASDIAYVRVIQFYDVQVEVEPGGAERKPGMIQNYTVTGTNMGNDPDSMSVEVEFKDFNQSGCTLTTLGKDDGCPFRAWPTVIQRDNWTTVKQLATSFGPLLPTVDQNDGFAITVPRDWAAMEDTTYEFVITVVSSGDEDPRASGTSIVEHTAVATKESMTRYTSLEIDELIGEVEKANAQGIKTGGLLPIAMHPAQKKINQALELILDGQPAKASNALSSNAHIMEAFIHALDGFSKKLPVSLVDDWRARALAIIEDLQTAAASGVTSAL